MKSATTLFAFLILSATGLRAQFLVNPTADRVLGQPDFTTSAAAVNQASMLQPSGVAVDPVSGKVFVSISGQHRILRFASSAAVANGANAEAVIGQTSYTTATVGVSAAALDEPWGIDLDSAGRLWVADYDNNRVLMYEDAANLPEFGATADLVLGQPNFDTRTPGTNQITMRGPVGVHVDASGKLWVADYGNNRVLRYDSAATLGDGAPATAVLGQPGFDTGVAATTSVGMTGPAAVLLDPTGRLWVAEQENNRVLRFDGAATLANGSPANGVLGQTDFVTDTSGSTPEKFDQPNALAVDRNGTLYVADYNGHRVIYHRSPATKANGATPDGVIGQPDLATVTSGTSAQKLTQPYGGLDFEAAGNLWITDFNNNRAIRFPGDFTTAAPKVTGRVPRTSPRASLPLRGTATDPNGIARITWRVGGKGSFKTANGTTSWRFNAPLKNGLNLIEIVAEDTFGNTSPVTKVRVTRQLPRR
jgi:sugar lactone lactonase YvrE